MGIIGKQAHFVILDGIQEEKTDAPRVHNRYHNTAPADAVYVGRGSPWGNPFRFRTGKRGYYDLATREEAIHRFKCEILPHLDLTPLKGKHLVCFCKPKACHADLLFEAANKES